VGRMLTSRVDPWSRSWVYRGISSRTGFVPFFRVSISCFVSCLGKLTAIDSLPILPTPQKRATTKAPACFPGLLLVAGFDPACLFPYCIHSNGYTIGITIRTCRSLSWTDGEEGTARRFRTVYRHLAASQSKNSFARTNRISVPRIRRRST